MLRPAFAIALPALGLGWILSQSNPDQRAVWAASLRDRMGFSAQQSARAAAVATPTQAFAATPRIPVSLGPDTFTIDADRGGQFETTMLVNGRQLPVLIDTGATYVALTSDDAAVLGIHPAERDFKYAFQTANGVARAAATLIPEIRVGNVAVRNVQAFVSQPGTLTSRSLLGMSFLRQLSGFEIHAGQLVLRQ